MHSERKCVKALIPSTTEKKSLACPGVRPSCYSHGGVNPCANKEDLLPTYSMDSKGYRTIWIDGIKEIRGGKMVVKFD